MSDIAIYHQLTNPRISFRIADNSGVDNSGAPISAPPPHRGQGCWLRQVHAGDLHDGLPRGFLAGAIVEVWVALRLNWA
jgi:hypothetical protein